jgi:hypothetical protein
MFRFSIKVLCISFKEKVQLQFLRFMSKILYSYYELKLKPVNYSSPIKDLIFEHS